MHAIISKTRVSINISIRHRALWFSLRVRPRAMAGFERGVAPSDLCFHSRTVTAVF